MCGLDWGTDNGAGKSMIDRSQINRALKLGVFVQLQSKETKGGGVDGGAYGEWVEKQDYELCLGLCGGKNRNQWDGSEQVVGL